VTNSTEISLGTEPPAPKRIQRKRTKGWRMPEGAVYVGRPTKWGNPYDWREYPTLVRGFGADDGEPTRVSDASRKRFAVVDFKSVCVHEIGSFQYPSRDEIRRELAGKDLACWCPLDQPCHADVLLELANPTPSTDAAEAAGDEDR
jgi:hypothetical protein